MTRVYLSSTRLDLEAERQAVTEWLIAADFQPVHSYFATSETVRESCLEDIAGCDFLVLIVGHRYGHQPKDGNPENLSITCLEFRKTRQIGLPCLAFLRTSVPDIHLSDQDDPIRYPLIQTFRSEVADTARPAEFKDLTGFIAAFSAAILRHVTKLLKQRDANAPVHEQRIGELEAELQATRESALSRVLADAEQPQADDLAQRARTALLKGETSLAEELLREQEDRAANAAGENRREAATLARQIASLAVGRDNRAALAALERAAGYLPTDFWTQIELGDARALDGQSNDAQVSYRAAHTIAETLAARDPANTQWQRDLSVCHNKIGDVLLLQGDGPRALASFLQGHAIAAALADHDPANTGWQRGLSVSYERIGEILLAQGDRAGAFDAFHHNLAIAAALADHAPANVQWQRDLSVSHIKIGDVLVAQGDDVGALAAFRSALAIREALAARDPDNVEWQRDLSVSLDKISNMLPAQHDGQEVLAAYRKSLAICEVLAARDPTNTECQRSLSVGYLKVGDALVAQSDGQGALAAFLQGHTIAAILAARDSTNVEWQRDLSVSLDKIGDILLAQDDGLGALAAFNKSLAIREALAARDPANTEWQRDLIIIHVKLADASGDKSHFGRALSIAEAMQTRGTLAPRDAWMIEDLKKRASA